MFPFVNLVQVIALLGCVVLLVKPVGSYMAKVYQSVPTMLSPVLVPCENLLYRLCGVSRDEEMGWQRYATAMLLFNLAGFLLLLAILLCQSQLPFNPRQLPAFPWSLALNTAVSFSTNTNWQMYSGEQTASYFTQMVGLTVQNFVSAATGMAIAIALIRGLARRKTALIGNFYVDLTRTVLYLFLPLSLAAALVLVSQGVIQNLRDYQPVSLVQSAGNFPAAATLSTGAFVLPMGPVASQEVIKELGTNGGGFFNANSAHPYENPTPLSNFIEMLLILLIPASLTHTFGLMVGNPRQGRGLLLAMLAMLSLAIGLMSWAESAGHPLLTKLGVEGAYLEGKEVRFGSGGSLLFSTATTATSCGAVNAMHDSLTPIGGLVPLLLILTGEVVFGGVGSGLYTMLGFVVIAVFIAGLMIGRTPEYLGKKVEAREMWLSIVTVLTSGIVVLVFSGVALLTPSALSAMANPGAHGLSEVLYAFASTANNNGSAFGGLGGNLFYHLATSAAMLLGRFVPAVAVLAMAGGLAEKRSAPPSLGTLPTDQMPFVVWLVLVILIVGALTFFPALAMGPIIEHLALAGGR